MACSWFQLYVSVFSYGQNISSRINMLAVGLFKIIFSTLSLNSIFHFQFFLSFLLFPWIFRVRTPSANKTFKLLFFIYVSFCLRALKLTRKLSLKQIFREKNEIAVN